MGEPMTQTTKEVDELLATIAAKLAANAGIIARSLAYGRLSWRRGRTGQFEVDLDPRL